LLPRAALGTLGKDLPELLGDSKGVGVSPPDAVIDDVFVVARRSLTQFIQAARLAVEDHRDLRMAADATRG